MVKFNENSFDNFSVFEGSNELIVRFWLKLEGSLEFWFKLNFHCDFTSISLKVKTSPLGLAVSLELSSTTGSFSEQEIMNIDSINRDRSFLIVLFLVTLI